MNHSELIDRVTTRTGEKKAEVKALIEAVFAEISDAATRGEDVSVSGLGQFKVKDVPARQGRNPATGKAMEIAASRKVSFVAAKALKDALKS